jgi:hypothetical protein
MTGDSGFRVFALDHATTIRTIRHRLQEIRESYAIHLIAGSAQDWGDYQRRVGRLEGLDEALHVCNDIEKAEQA